MSLRVSRMISLLAFIWLCCVCICHASSSVSSSSVSSSSVSSSSVSSSSVSSSSVSSSDSYSRLNEAAVTANTVSVVKDANTVSIQKVKEYVLFQGYRNIVRRDIRLPSGTIVPFDVLVQRHGSVTVFVWDSASKSATLIREYHPGPEKAMYGVVAGMYETEKQNSPLHCAQCELEEEAQLAASEWHYLLKSADGIPLDKYSNNTFFPFLAVNPSLVVHGARAMDDEEHIDVFRNVSVNSLNQLMANGRMNLISSFTTSLALKKIDELGL